MRAVLWVLVATLGEVVLKLFPEMLVLSVAVDEEYICQVLVLSCLTHGSLVGGSQHVVAHGVLQLGAVFPEHFMPKFHSNRTGNVMSRVEMLVPLRVTQATLLGIQHG